MGVADLSAVSLLIMCVATNSSVMHPTRLDTVPGALAEMSARTHTEEHCSVSGRVKLAEKATTLHT